MTRFLLVRHGVSEANISGILAGNRFDSTLTPKGRRQARAVASHLRGTPVGKIYTSPMIRCRETAEPLREIFKKRVQIDDSFIEMDYGRWSGRKLRQLRKERMWKQIQEKPSRVVFPEGESFEAAQRRVIRGLRKIAKAAPTSTVVIVSHGDIIKMAVTWALGMELDKFQRIIIDPGSISIIDIQGNSFTVESINQNVGRRFIPQNTKAVKLKSRRVVGGGSGA